MQKSEVRQGHLVPPNSDMISAINLASQKIYKKEYYMPRSSVANPSHFDVDPDPDPGIHIWEQWIHIRNTVYFCYHQSLEKAFLRWQKHSILSKLFLTCIVLVCSGATPIPINALDPDLGEEIEMDPETEQRSKWIRIWPNVDDLQCYPKLRFIF